MSVRPRSIAFVTQNPGGFQAVYPVYAALRNHPAWSVRAWFGDEVRALVAGSDVPLVSTTDATHRAMVDALVADPPEVLLVGTSGGASLEKTALRIARDRRIPSVGLIDYWGGVVERCSTPGTNDFAFVPNRLCVIDVANGEEYVAQGMDRSRIVQTGNPYFTVVRRRNTGDDDSDRGPVLFLDQPFTDRDGAKYGYTEGAVLQDIVAALDALHVDAPVRIALHPRSSGSAKYADVLHGMTRSVAIVAASGSVLDHVHRARLVIGMNTAVLFHAALLGRRVISYQPNLRGTDPLRSNALGVTTPVYTRDALPAAIAVALHEPRLTEDQQHLLDAYADDRILDRVLAVLTVAASL